MSEEKTDPIADAIARGDVLPEPTEPETSVDEGTQASPPSEQTETPSAEEGEAASTEDVEAAAAEEPPTEDDVPKEHMIPKNRFDQAVGKERDRAAQLEAELNQYRTREEQQKLAQDHEAAMEKQKELLKQHSSLLADGELDKASDIMAEVLQLRDDMTQARAQQLADNARNSAKIEVQYDATVQRLEAEYPEINPDSDEFDEATVSNVQAMVTGIMRNEGKDPAQALVKATDILLKPLKEAKNQTLREKPSEEVVQQGMRRQQAQIDKNVEAAAKQPPSTQEVGADHDKTGGALDAQAVQSMSWDEFVQIPDEELAKIRGDFIQ